MCPSSRKPNSAAIATLRMPPPATPMAQLANFHQQIEAEIRDNMLDVAAAQQLVDVARSNVDLGHATVNDATDRFRNGMDNDLPVVEAQSSLATAEAQLVNSLYEYNVAKIALARSLGIVDREYREYLTGPADAAQSSVAQPDNLNRPGGDPLTGKARGKFNTQTTASDLKGIA